MKAGAIEGTKMEQKIFPIELVLEAMKDNGYKDAAYAVAELIDNSIQAGTGFRDKTSVELICLEEDSFIQERASSQIRKIAVYDNASGMSKETLQASLAFGQGTRRNAKAGIGKFGMGLPNASISQCNRVDVYSWQNGKTFRTYLDIREIAKDKYETIPEPVESEIPKEWLSVIKAPLSDSGTLVIWSDLDRLKWKRHKAFFSNVEFIIGRMYRYFISSNACTIRMAAFNNEGCVFDELVKPNDPLYLMEGTNTPPPFESKAGFVPYTEEEIPISLNGKMHTVKVKFSIADHAFRKNFNAYYPQKSYKSPGDTPFGKHCAKNTGISIVRAGRELELNNSFTNDYDPTERWWGAEISFEPDLDEAFGVTNNKQAATALKRLSIDEIAADEGFSGRTEARNYLAENYDTRLPIIQISERVSSILGSIRGELKKQTEGSQKADDYKDSGKDAAADAASKVDKQIDGEGESDKKQRALSQEQKEREMAEELDRDGVSLSPEDKQKLILDCVNNDEKFIITVADMRGASVIFDVTTPAGKLKVTINESHPFYKNLIEKLADDSKAYDIIKLLFSAWALMEDKQQNPEYREWLLETRMEWGHIVKKMLNEYLSS